MKKKLEIAKQEGRDLDAEAAQNLRDEADRREAEYQERKRLDEAGAGCTCEICQEARQKREEEHLEYMRAETPEG